MSELPDANVSEARRWLTQARTNLAGARQLAQGQFWPQGCFFCQQAAETALKAILIHTGERDLQKVIPMMIKSIRERPKE